MSAVIKLSHCFYLYEQEKKYIELKALIFLGKWSLNTFQVGLEVWKSQLVLHSEQGALR